MENIFQPKEGMIINGLPNGNGYTGIIEYVGKDYFILRSARTGKPVLIQPFQYHNFERYIKE